MAKAYTPGLKVSSRTTHRARRLLPISGELKVEVGDDVSADQVVAETFMEGDVSPMNISNKLSCAPGEVRGLMIRAEGEKVSKGDPYTHNSIVDRKQGIGYGGCFNIPENNTFSSGCKSCV